MLAMASNTCMVCTRCHTHRLCDVNMMKSCQTCVEHTLLCPKCAIVCICKMDACLECFTKSHTATCYNKRHHSTKWNPVLLWTCSCHDVLRETDFHQQMDCDNCNKTKLCHMGAADCECDLTLCKTCMLYHDCPAEKEFEKQFLSYRCTFRKPGS